MGRLRFTPTMDSALKAYREEHPELTYQDIARHFGWNTRQVRDRLQYIKNPQRLWSDTEDSGLFRLVGLWGTNWAKIGHRFEGRLPVQVKNHYQYIKHKPKLPKPKRPAPVPVPVPLPAPEPAPTPPPVTLPEPEVEKVGWPEEFTFDWSE
jgi:hypothetical protein